MRLLQSTKRKLATSIIALAAITIITYWPGLNGPFLFDDIANIIDNPYLRINDLSFPSLYAAASTNSSGPTGRPLSSLSFALNFYATDGAISASAMKATNLAIHVLNGVLVLCLSYLILTALVAGNRLAASKKECLWLAVACGSIWTLHPFQLTAVLYVVQRMTSLAATFTIIGLIFFIIGRRKLTTSSKGISLILTGIIFVPVIGLGAKETAALTPLFALLIEVTVFRGVLHNPRLKKHLNFIYITFIAIPCLLSALWFFQSGMLSEQYATRSFTLTERLLTESRILWLYLSSILLPRTNSMGLFLDDIAISHGFLQPLTTAFSVISLIGLASLLLYGLLRNKLPWVVLGLSWFFIGHLIESTVLPLELAFEHRNYTPSFGVVLFVVIATYKLLNRANARRSVVLLAAILPPITLAAATHVRAGQWSSRDTLTALEVLHHPTSPRALRARGLALEIQGRPDEAYDFHRRSAELDTQNLSGLIRMRGILNLASYALDQGTIDPEPLPPTDDPANITYLSAITLHPEYLNNMAKAVEEELLRRVREEKKDSGTIMALQSLAGCVASIDLSCRTSSPLAKLLIETLLQSENLSNTERAHLNYNLARMAMHFEDWEDAETHLDHAIDAKLIDLQMLVALADVQIQLGKINEATRTIERYRSSDTQPTFRRDVLQQLENNLTNRPEN